MSDELDALEAKNADARRLARLASLAVQVEPELLRRLRLRLLPTADASAEADVWFSEAVDSKSPNAMVLRADVRAQLQQELSAADRDAAASIIEEMHAGISEVVRIQEQVDALSLRGDLAEIEKVLQPIVRTLYDTGHAGLARWAARAFAEFQPEVQTTPTAWTMMRAAAVRLRGDTPASGWQSVESAIRGLPRTGVYLALYRDSLVIGSPPIEHAMRIEIPVTEPLMLEVTSSLGTSRVAFGFGQLTEVPVDPHDAVVTTVTGERYAIRTAAKLDDWAIVLAMGEEGVADAELFRKWLLSPEGGAVPDEQCAFRKEPPGWPNAILISDLVARWEIDLRERPRRRFYLYAGGGQTPNDRPFLSYIPVQNALKMALQNFHEVIVFIDVPNGGPFNPPPPGTVDSLWIVGVGSQGADQPRTFTSRLVEALAGAAASDDGVVSDAELVNTLPEADWSAAPPLDLLSSDAFVTTIELRNQQRSEALEVRILDERFEEVVRIRHEGPARRRLLRGRYTLDAPALSLVQRFETGDEAPLVAVDIRRRQLEHWIIVAGTGEGKIPHPQHLLAAAVGKRLAGSGFRLLLGDWPGIDFDALGGFLSTMETLNMESREQIRQFSVEPRQGAGRFVIVPVANEEEEFDAALREASALIAIGGLGGTFEYGRRAHGRQIPVLPVASTGGDAAKLYEELPGGPAWLENPVETEADANDMAIRVVAWLLDHLPPVAPPDKSATSA